MILIKYWAFLEVIKMMFHVLPSQNFSMYNILSVVIQFLLNWILCTYNVLLFRFSLIWPTVKKVKIKKMCLFKSLKILFCVLLCMFKNEFYFRSGSCEFLRENTDVMSMKISWMLLLNINFNFTDWQVCLINRSKVCFI